MGKSVKYTQIIKAKALSTSHWMSYIQGKGSGLR